MRDDNLIRIMDALTDTGIYVVEQSTHKLLYFNRWVKGMCPDIQVGMPCHEIWKGNCGACPMDDLAHQDKCRTVLFDRSLGTNIDITADKLLWDGSIPAAVISVTPHQLNFEEAQGLAQIEKMYAQSLVTIFKECIIVNLTADYYVNCQKDMLWTDIPERGNFGEENRRYSQIAVHPDDLQRFEENFSREAMLRLFQAGQKQITKRLRRKVGDGTYHMVEFTATQIEGMDDGGCWCVLVFRDIHEAYLQEQQKNLEISQLATAVRGAYQMLISVNLTQNSYYMLEYDRFDTKKAATSGTFDDLITVGASTVDPDFREEFVRKFSRASLLDAFQKGEQGVSMELRQLGDDGVYHWNSTQVVRVHSLSTDDVLEITMSKNIDEERRQQEESLEKERQAKQLLEEALQKAQEASRAKSDFLSRMSHDIRTPMNAIMGMTALAQAHLQDVDKLQDYLQKIEVSGAHLLGLINEVLDMSKIESGTVELAEIEFDLKGLIQDALFLVQPAALKKGQEMEAVYGIRHPVVLGDPQRLSQVLVNILENASKYTGQGGHIEISVQEHEAEDDGGGTYRFQVRDNGIGMKPEYLKHIFEPFSRAGDTHAGKVAGTGLGMTIVRSLVDMMGGRIDVESEYGKGSCFTITLYLARQDTGRAPEQKAEAAEGQDFRGMRILLVEDNALNQQIAEEMLAMLGVTVELAEDGQKAVDAVLTHPPLYYDLVFMDIQMPLLNGYQAAERIRKSGKERIAELPIIAMTADAFTEDIRQAKLAGMNDHLAKPITIGQLKHTLSHWAGKKEQNSRYLRAGDRQPL